MRRTMVTVTLLVIASTFAAAAVQAAGGVRYKWRDSEGNLHYSDALPVDAGKHGYDVISAQGLLMKRVEPAKSAEELARAKTAETKAAAEKLEADARARNDQQLLAGYPTEQDLIREHQQQLEILQQTIRAAELSLQNQERSLADLLGNAADVERDGKQVPQRLLDQIAEQRRMIEAQHGVISRRTANLENARGKFSSELDHYRALHE